MNQLLHQHTESIVSAAIHAVLPDVAVVRALQGYRFGTGKSFWWQQESGMADGKRGI